MGNMCGSDGVGGSGERTPLFAPIPDQYNSLEELQIALRNAGLESSNLLIGLLFYSFNNF